MPEGDTIFRAARTLKAALAGKTVTRFETVLPYLARVNEDTPITGRTVEDVVSHGKWTEMRFSGGLILLTHMLMSGNWHIYRPGEKWQRRRQDMRIVIGTESLEAIAFNVPIAEFHTADSLARRPGFDRLGQDVLAAEFSEKEALAQLRSRPDQEIGEALLNQSLVAGIGNVYKSEVAFASGVNPFRKVSQLGDDDLIRIVRIARKFLKANVRKDAEDGIVTYTGFRRTTGRSNPTDRLWVYGRGGQACRRCGSAIQMKKQGEGARVTFWCANCQR